MSRQVVPGNGALLASGAMQAALLAAALPGAGPGTVLRAYDPAAWGSFFTALVTAAAALTGLLFVAVSINLSKIVPVRKADDGAVDRAADDGAGDRAAEDGAGDRAADDGAGDRAADDGVLAARAAETLSSLLLVVVTGALTFVPQVTRLLGLELILVAGPMLAVTTRTQLRHWRKNPDQPLYWTVSRMSTTAVGTVPATWAGISLAAHWGGGLYWLAAAALAGIVGAVLNAWVLLVEIIR
jgi:hypothetical protein